MATLILEQSYERTHQAEAELKAQIDALLARAKAIDEAEAEANEPELDIPAEIQTAREARLAAIREARERTSVARAQRDQRAVPAPPHWKQHDDALAGRS